MEAVATQLGREGGAGRKLERKYLMIFFISKN
jgi:hypothetical protein